MEEKVNFDELMKLSRQMTLDEFHSRYTFVKIITKTKNSTIRLATHIRTKQNVIIKSIFKNSLIEHQKKVDALVREIKTLIMLRDNKHVTQIYDVVFSFDTFFIVLEYADYGDLFTYIKKNNQILSEFEVKHFMSNIIKIVSYLHLHKIAHRDLKLENILLDQSGRVMLADFGFATNFDSISDNVEDNLCSSICGTLHYEPPEIVRGDKYNPVKSDAWSVGVILYLLMFKTFPFNSPSMTDTIQLILTSDIKYPEAVDNFSLELSEILSSLLVKDPNERKSILEIAQEHDHFFGFKGKIKAKFSEYKQTYSSGKNKINSKENKKKSERIHNAALNTILCAKEDFENLSFDEMISYQIVKRRYQIGQMNHNQHHNRVKTIAPGEQFLKTPRNQKISPRLNQPSMPSIMPISLQQINMANLQQAKPGILLAARKITRRHQIRPMSTVLDPQLQMQMPSQNLDLFGIQLASKDTFPIPECDSTHQSDVDISVVADKIMHYIKKNERFTILCQEESGVYIKVGSNLYVLLSFCGNTNKSGYLINMIRGNTQELKEFEKELANDIGF